MASSKNYFKSLRNDSQTFDQDKFIYMVQSREFEIKESQETSKQQKKPGTSSINSSMENQQNVSKFFSDEESSVEEQKVEQVNQSMGFE